MPNDVSPPTAGTRLNSCNSIEANTDGIRLGRILGHIRISQSFSAPRVIMALKQLPIICDKY